MKYNLRFFIDKNHSCKPEHVFTHKSAASMIVPQIGSTIFLHDDEYKVTDVSYDVYADDNVGLIDVFVLSKTEEDFG